MLFLLGVQDIVYWARELGGTKTARFTYPHSDWRLGYFIVLLVFYLFLSWVSEIFFNKLTLKVSKGQATLNGTVGGTIDYISVSDDEVRNS